MSRAHGKVKLRLPATSANLGPGFDTAGLALDLWLHVKARPAESFSIKASGRDAEQVGQLNRNLLLHTYKDVLRKAGKDVTPLRLRVKNEIPLGMGCGSSAAALLAGVALADRFGGLRLGDDGIVAEASRREGHPDNVAACWYGGFTVSAAVGESVEAVAFAGEPKWRLLLVMQRSALATSKARALLPESYSRGDTVFNVQRAALLVAAFSAGKLGLLKAAMDDRMHQPFRGGACPLLPALLPLREREDVAGVALSGAGPSVLLVLREDADEDAVVAVVRETVGEQAEILPVRIAGGAKWG